MTKKKFISLVFFIFNLVFLANLTTSFAQEEVANPATEASTSASTGTSNFNTDLYRIYNTKGYPDFDDKFHLTPIKNALKSNSGSTAEQYKNLRTELAKTGYEAYCLAEEIKIEPQYNTTKLIETFLEQYPNGINLNTFSKEILGMEDANFPIWRDVADKQFLMTSLEEYFGFKDLYEENPAKTEIKTAAINSLLSQEQSCVQSWITLGTERRACNRLQDPSTCAFTKRKIPGSGYEVHDIMGMLSDFTGGNWVGGDQKSGEELAIQWCEVIFSEPLDPTKSTLNATQKELLKPIKDNIINVPTYMDRGYRYGFIVAAVETRIPEKSGDHAGLIFNFFTERSEENKRDEVLVAAFKLPDIGTNKGYGTEFGHEEWDDPLDLSRLVLTTSEAHDLHEIKRLEKRDEILAEAIAAEVQSQSSKIYCCAGALPGSNCTNTCALPLPKALTDIINGNAEQCETEAEVVNEIRDLAGLRDATDIYGKLFKNENGGQVLLNLFLGSIYNNKGLTPDHAETNPGEPKIESIWTINNSTWPPKTGNSVVHFYLVYPVGFELETVEEAIKGAFFTEDQIATMNMDESIVNVFEVTGQNQSLQGGSVGWTFVDKVRTANWECGAELDKFGVPTGRPEPCKEHPSIGIEQDTGKIDVLGGKLSWWLRKVQVALSAKFSFAHSYYQSCKTMEEFLLGKCAGSSVGGGNNEILPDFGSICEVAEAYNIDCVFFKAIYAVETCSGRGMPSGGEAGCCNSIGYCGPMQVGGGVVGIISNGENLDVCMEESEGTDSFELAARWLLIKKWCNFNAATCLGSPNPYEWKEEYIESQGNSDINTRDEVEDFILGWYGSINQPEPRWGGLTYVDAVMEYLKTGSLWGDCAYKDP